MTDKKDSPNRVLLAVRLGWLVVEVFGRLREYTQSSRKGEVTPSSASQRFDFSERSLDDREAIFLAAGQLRRTAASLGPGLPSLPLPAHSELERALAVGLDLDALYGELNDWSTQVWIALSTEDDVIGRGFTYGGSLADTYWHAQTLGLEGFGELLRPQRLEYIAQRFDSITEHLPPYTARVLHHTLYWWRIEDQVRGLDPDQRGQALRRLASQAKVWHDLLFGGRTAESYLTARDRRLITWGTTTTTAALVLVSMVLVWLAVLALSSAGRNVAASISGVPQELGGPQATLLEDLGNWQTWSTLLATFSSLAVLLTGLVTRLSGWVIGFQVLAREWLKLWLIRRRAYRDWRV